MSHRIVTRFICIHCGALMEWNAVAWGTGKCPNCGKAGRAGIARVVPQRIRYLTPKWKFWIRPRKYEVVGS